LAGAFDSWTGLNTVEDRPMAVSARVAIGRGDTDPPGADFFEAYQAPAGPFPR
jgi:hypothetical protein